MILYFENTFFTFEKFGSALPWLGYQIHPHAPQVPLAGHRRLFPTEVFGTGEGIGTSGLQSFGAAAAAFSWDVFD
jgi:hypothetical protein